MISDPFAMKAGSHEPSRMGDLIALAGAGFGAISMTAVSYLPKDMPPLTKLYGSVFFIFIYQSILFPFFIGFSNYYSTTPEIGVYSLY